MRDDIYGALKNALARGATLDQAVKSLINSGYSDIEVRKVAKQFTGGSLSTLNPTVPPKTSQTPQARQPRPQQKRPTTKIQQTRPTGSPLATTPVQRRPLTNYQSSGLVRSPSYQEIKPYKKLRRGNVGKIILLSTALFILIVVLILTILFREDLANYIRNLF